MRDDELLRQLAAMRAEIAALKAERVSHRNATVTAIDPATATFTADVAGAGILAGIPSASDFLPSEDDLVTLDMRGPVPTHVPGRVTSEDTVALDSLSVTNDPDIMGQPFSEHLAPKFEFQAGASLGSLIDPGTTPVGGGEMGFYEATFEFEANHMYEITSSNFWIRTITNPSRVDVNVRYTVSVDPNTAPPAVSLTSNYFMRWPQADITTSSIGHSVQLSKLVLFPIYTHFRFLITLFSVGGQGFIEMGSENHFNSTIGSTIEPEVVQLWADDKGLVPWTNRAVQNSGSGTPAAVTRKVYTYYPNWSRRFTGSGAIHSNQTHAAQGQAPDNPANGNQASQFGDFKRDGTGNAIATDLSGATLEKLEVFLYPREWGLANGGTASIKYHTNTTAPGSLSGGAGTAVSSSGWKAWTGRWVDITSQFGSVFQAGTAKGIQIGPGISTAAQYFGVFADNNDAHPPSIRATFTK